MIDHNVTVLLGRTAAMQSIAPTSSVSLDSAALFPKESLTESYSPAPATNVVESECFYIESSLPLHKENVLVSTFSNITDVSEVQVINSDQYCCPRTETLVRAEDPKLEDYYKAVKKPVLQSTGTTPSAAWVLLSLVLLSHIQKNATESIIGEMAQLYATASVNGHNRNKPYSKQLMIFCMTLAGYSAKAYSYLRSVAKKCIPTPETLKKYRNRVDGSPGFSLAALKMIKAKVAEMAEKSKNLFLSLSCDDISIRCVLPICFIPVKGAQA